MPSGAKTTEHDSWKLSVSMTVNGQARTITVEPGTTLLHACEMNSCTPVQNWDAIAASAEPAPSTSWAEYIRDYRQLLRSQHRSCCR